MGRALRSIVSSEPALPEVADAWDRQLRTAEGVIERFDNGYDTVLLADEVGMGKTYAALAVAAHEVFQSRHNNRKVLLIVPQNSVLLSKWEREIRSFNKKYLLGGNGGRGGKGKSLRPMVVGGFWDLVQNLHDFDNVGVKRMSEGMKQCFALALWQWAQRRRRKYARMPRWSRFGDLNQQSPEYYDFCSRFSLRTLFEFLDMREARNRGEITGLVNRLRDEHEGTEWRLRDLFHEFAHTQDAYEPNVFLMGMGALRRTRRDHTDARLFSTYIMDVALKGKWEDSWRRALGNAQDLVLARESHKRWNSYIEYNKRLGQKDLWGMRDCVEHVLNEHSSGEALLRAAYDDGSTHELAAVVAQVSSRAIRRKLRQSGIGLAIVDEVHNWKNGGNGAWEFARAYAPYIGKRLIMSATPFQIHEGELERVFRLSSGAMSDSGDMPSSTSAAAVAAIVRGGGVACACMQASDAFLDAWKGLSAESAARLHKAFTAGNAAANVDTVTAAFENDPNTEDDLRHFIIALRRYRESIDRLRDELRTVVIRHTKNRDKRHFHAGKEYVTEGCPDYGPKRRTLYETPGNGNEQTAFLSYLAMRADMLVRRETDTHGRTTNAHLLNGLTSSTSAFEESNEHLQANPKLSAATKHYLNLFTGILKDHVHPKVAATVARAFDNYRRGQKTLIFCTRLKTVEEIWAALTRRIEQEVLAPEGFDGAVTSLKNVLRNYRQVDFSWSRSWIAAQEPERAADLLRSCAAWRQETRVLVEKHVRDINDTAGSTRAARLSGRQLRRLVDLIYLELCVAHCKGAPAHGTMARELAASILNHPTALQLFLGLRKPTDGQLIEDETDDEEAAGEIVREITALFDSDSIWCGSPDDRTLHDSVWRLVESEAELLKRETPRTKGEALAITLNECAQGLRKVLLRTDLVPRMRKHGLAGAVHQMPIALTDHPIVGTETSWSRTSAFVQSLVDAEGSISSRTAGASHRQSLWRGVFLRGQEASLVGKLTGGVVDQTRVNRCAAFNSPLIPDILVCTAIGAEGIDLHTRCAEVIHHDLPWNPAKLEQRTGRIDRVGSLSERIEKLRLHIGIPFLAHNYEKFQYDLVVRRAQKFEVLLGKPEFVTDVPDEETANANGRDIVQEEVEADGGFEDIPAVLPQPIIDYLQMDLSVDGEPQAK